MASDNTQSADTMAKLLDISPRRLHQLVDMGVMPKIGRGKYPLVQCVHAYIHYLRDLGLKSDAQSPGGIVTHKDRLTKAQADKAEIEAMLAASNAVMVKDVAFTWSNAVLSMKTRLLSIPSKAAPLASASQTPQEAEGIIKKMIYDALEELSNGQIEIEIPDEEPEPSPSTDADSESDQTASESDS